MERREVLKTLKQTCLIESQVEIRPRSKVDVVISLAGVRISNRTLESGVISKTVKKVGG